MTSIITGDIINSRKANATRWLKELKRVLNNIGESPKYWEIFRGDSFQAEVPDPADALLRAIEIKAAARQIKGTDVRMCIGLGEKNYVADRISESNGAAFIYSGEGFEELEKMKQSLAVRSSNTAFDDEMNLYLRLLLIAMDNWTPKSAEYVSLSLTGNMKQELIAKKLNISQSSVSERHQRSYLSEVREVENRYREKVNTYNLSK